MGSEMCIRDSLIGEGRGKPRIEGEEDAEYRVRIRQSATTRSCGAMIGVLRRTAGSNQVTSSEWYHGGMFLPDGRDEDTINQFSSFFDVDGVVHGENDLEHRNTFWTLFPREVDFSNDTLRQEITEAIEDNTAMGVNYGIIQRIHAI